MEVEIAVRREREVDLIVDDRVVAILLPAREKLQPDAPACRVEEVFSSCGLRTDSVVCIEREHLAEEGATHPGVARRNPAPVRRMGVPKRYMRATLMYSGSVLLYRLTNHMSLLTSSMRVLTVPHCSISTSMLLAEMKDIFRWVGIGKRRGRSSLLRRLFVKAHEIYNPCH